MTVNRLWLAAALALAAILVSWAGTPAVAHSQSYGYLNATVGEDSVTGSLDVATRDLNTLFDLDANRDSKLTWGEFRVREAEITQSLLRDISIGGQNSNCRLTPKPALTDSRGGEIYLLVPFASQCSLSTGPIEISYRLLFNVDAQHRGLIAVTDAKGTQSFVMTPDQTHVTIDAGRSGSLTQFMAYVGHGTHHIWIGADHILFLITLLLGTLAQAKLGEIRHALVNSIKVVTAFTLSHSVTLALAALGMLRIPVPLAESLIAVTIAAAAVNNIWPFLTRRIWLVALIFGLIHGVGFANVLADLGLPRDSLIVALLAFNIGVEVGQLVIVAAAFPVIVLAMRLVQNPIGVSAANLAIAGIGAAWFSDRALGTAILPF